MRGFLSLLARISFAVTVFLIPFRWRMTLLKRPNPSVYSEYTDFLLYALDVAMLVTLVSWGLSFVFERKRVRIGPRHVWIPLLGLTCMGGLSLVSSLDPQLTAYHALRFSLLFLFFLFIVTEIRSSTWVTLPVCLLILFQSVTAIGQSFVQHDIGLQALGEYVLDPAVPGTSVLEAGGVRLLRAYGMSDHPNILGGCLAIGLLILLGAYMRVYNGETRIAIASIFVAGSAGLLLTFSRSAWLSFLAGAMVILIGEAAQRNLVVLKRVAFLFMVCIVLNAGLVARNYPYFAGRFNAGDSFAQDRVEHGSLKERSFLFLKGSELVLRQPFLSVGVGLGVSVVAMKQAYPIFPMSYQPPHLTLLVAALEIGLLGGLFYLSLMVFPVVAFLWQRGRFFRSTRLCTAFAVILALLLIGCFDHYPWMIVPGRFLQWLGWGLWAVSIHLHEAEEGQAQHEYQR